MKKLFLNFLLTLSFLVPFSLTSNAEPVDFESIKLSLPLENIVESDDFVSKHNDITLKIGTLEFPAIFIYKDEKAPYQGYLIKFNDFLGVETFVENINKGCDILYDELLKECKAEVVKCQKDCDQRVDLVLKEKDDLQLKLNIQIEETDRQKTHKYIWAGVGIVAGAGLGILTYELAK